MPSRQEKRKNRVPLSKERTEELFACGEQLRETAMSLHEEWQKRMRRNTRGRERLRLRGYSILVPVLQALATEYMLKGLAARDNGNYLPTHDLYELYKDLDLKTRARVGSFVVSDIGSKLPEFLEAQRNDFIDWRYVFEGRTASTHHSVFDKVLEVLIDDSYR